MKSYYNVYKLELELDGYISCLYVFDGKKELKIIVHSSDLNCEDIPILARICGTENYMMVEIIVDNGLWLKREH